MSEIPYFLCKDSIERGKKKLFLKKIEKSCRKICGNKK